jgi:hypothetical protein
VYKYGVCQQVTASKGVGGRGDHRCRKNTPPGLNKIISSPCLPCPVVLYWWGFLWLCIVVMCHPLSTVFILVFSGIYGFVMVCWYVVLFCMFFFCMGLFGYSL